MHKEHIYIIGAGAIGKVLAVCLAHAGKRVTIIRGSVDHEPVFADTISVALPDDTTINAEIEFKTLSHFTVLQGLVILTNKSYGNTRLAQSLQAKIGKSPLVILQNGLGVEKPFIHLNYPEVYRCVLFATSQVMSINQLRFKPVSLSAVGIVIGSPGRLAEIVEVISSEHFQFRIESDIQTVIWKKAIINCVFNSVCPLLQTDNGIFNRDERVMAIAKTVIHERITIAADVDVHLSSEDVLDNLLKISRASEGQLISTYQDINNKRPTEIETLNFAIVETAKIVGKEHHVVNTHLLGELTRLKSLLAMADD